MKKLFSTRETDDSRQHRGRSIFRASLYKDIRPSTPPQVGTHPVRGNAVLRDGVVRPRTAEQSRIKDADMVPSGHSTGQRKQK
ncbi:MAG: hypothetical protein M4579_007106, partial [Chaenotheca gracillima]